MEWLLFVLGGGGAAAVGSYLRARRVAGRRRDQELQDVRRRAGEDVTLFGEQLSRLGEVLQGRDLDAATRADYQSALDAYEQAKRAVAALPTTEAARGVVDTLVEGRYAVACVQARATGRPLPERRVPCFFNPEHGPSAVDVVWTPPTGGTRKVPACAQDAARVAAGAEPAAYYLRRGELQVPYWEVGDPDQPYKFGIFDTSAARAVVMSLKMQNRGIDVGRGRKDPSILPRRSRSTRPAADQS
ncbi:hypothetical protein Kfla_5353 [Kribbella flavida DSM 17836]|uniref:Uncharacterized protein n=1 Tax=Kribbella flavida (strain DSM 17836 / JCM 10339 / NBRC 14399) TaxID=479435 RepID=D2PLB1_KRIFD|nr:hypothetical protein [Kribbella flavida]ADB34366.1 hypothetical protein Kfla_5353 [Kribbella flavida DSM 17836]